MDLWREKYTLTLWRAARELSKKYNWLALQVFFLSICGKTAFTFATDLSASSLSGLFFKVMGQRCTKLCGGKSKERKAQKKETECRICLDEETQSKDAYAVDKLISPCGCSGSQSVVHANCLKQWLRYKKTKICGVCCKTYDMAVIQNQAMNSRRVTSRFTLWKLWWKY